MDSMQHLIHDCGQIPNSGIAIRCGSAFFENEDLSWCLFIERLATEEDLQENHYLEEIGEQIWTTAVEIKFCPYCGVELLTNKPGGLTEEFGYFVHIDSSGWLSRYC